MIDQNGNNHGYMILRIPSDRVAAGKSLTIRVTCSQRNERTQLVIGCPEMPLMQFGAINTGRYIAGAVPQSTNLFSWPMNNYWVTNFNADQRGGHSWRYYLTTSSDVSNGFATRFGWGCRVP